MKTGLPEFCRAEKELSNDIYNAYEKIKKCGKISVWKKSRELMEQPNILLSVRKMCHKTFGSHKLEIPQFKIAI